jgi:2-deoxy-D-gluconate 3-dehydrogenase
VLNVNLNAVFRLAQEYCRHMLVHGGDKILNIASVVSPAGRVYDRRVCCSKHGAVGITQALCNEWGAGLTSTPLPRVIWLTEMNTALIADVLRSVQIGPRIPAGRWVNPKTSAARQCFLRPPPRIA